MHQWPVGHVCRVGKGRRQAIVEQVGRQVGAVLKTDRTHEFIVEGVEITLDRRNFADAKGGQMPHGMQFRGTC